jgi:hypothetical protein
MRAKSGTTLPRSGLASTDALNGNRVLGLNANEARSGPSKLDHTLWRGNSPSELEAFKMASGQYIGPEK